MPGLGVLTKELQIKIEAVDRASAIIDGVTKKINKHRAGLEKLNYDKSQGRKVTQKQIGAARHEAAVLQQANARRAVRLRTLQRERNALQRTTKQMGRFRMELLSVMFFAMGVNRLLMGIVKPALQAAKTFELFGMILRGIFIKEAIKVNALILDMWKKFEELDKPTQKAIKNFIIIGTVVSLLVMVLAMVGLGMKGLTLIFAKFTPLVMGAGSSLATLIGAIGMGGLVAILILAAAVVIGFIDAWKTNFGGIQEWTKSIFDGIKKVFKSIIDIITGVKDVIFGLFSGDSDMVLDGARKIVNGIIDLFEGLKQTMISILATIGLSVINAFKNVGSVIVDALGIAFGAFFEGAIRVLNHLINMANLIPGVNIPNIPEGGFKIIIPKFETGGYVPETGLAMLHAGEYVLPSHRVAGLGGNSTNVTFSPNVTITGNSPMDFDRVKSMLTDELVSEVERRIRR